MGIRGSQLAISLCVMLVGLCICHPHGHRRRHHLARAHRNQEHLCPSVSAAHPSAYPLSEVQFAHVRFDTDSLLKNLACRLDESCSQALLNAIAGTAKPYDLSHLDYPILIEGVLNHMRTFYDQFQHTMSQLSRLQSNLILGTSDPLVSYTQLLVNDLQELMCYIHRSTAVQIPETTGGVIGYDVMGEGAMLMEFIPLLKEFQGFIAHCVTVLKLRD